MSTIKNNEAAWLPTFSENDLNTLRKYLVGGLSLGASAGLITSFMNYIKNLHKNKNEDDDDTLYVYKKGSATNTAGDSYLATPLAITGGLLSTLASYALVKKLYTKMKLKAAQQELDEAQHAFISASGYETDKDLKKKASQGRSITMSELLLSAPVLIPMLTALASGTVAVKMLNKNFPTEIKKVTGPKRIEVIEKPQKDQDEFKPKNVEKQASVDASQEDATEFLIRATLLTRDDNSDLADLVAATATGELNSFIKTANSIGFTEALNTIKGAATREFSPLQEHLAIIALTKTSSIADSVGLLAAAEFANAQTNAFQQANSLSDEDKESLFKAASILGRAIRYELSEDLGIKEPSESYMSKTGASLSGLADMSVGALSDKMIKAIAIKKSLKKSDSKEDEQDEDTTVESGSFSDSSKTSGEEAGIKDGESPSRRNKKNSIKFISDTKSRRGFLSNIEPDILDEILNP